MPVTVLETARKSPDAKPPDADGPTGGDAAEQVKASSEESIARAKEADETREDAIHVETHVPPAGLSEAIGAAVEKGHDLMFLGLDPLAADDGGYHTRIKTALDAFKQSAVAVTGRGALRRNPDTSLRMLVPISGDNRSMRAIEFACLVAKASGGRVAAIAIAQEGSEGPSPNQLEAMFAHVREIGRHYEIEIEAIIGTGGRRELAILTHARRGRHNLIVLGVGRRAGDRLSLGSLADTLLETSDRSLALIITN